MLNEEDGKIMRDRLSRFLVFVFDARGCGYSLTFFCLFVLGLAIINPARASGPAKSTGTTAENAVVTPALASRAAKSPGAKSHNAAATKARTPGLAKAAG